MKKPLKSFIAIGVLSLMAGNAFAYTVNHSFTWVTPDCPKLSGSGSSANPALNKSAGSCTFTYPDNRPFNQARTLIVDNHLPNGSVLYSWSYDNFLPNFGWSCTSSGIKQCANTVKSNTGVIVNDIPYRLNMTYLSGATQLSPGIYKTSIEGIGIKFYLKVSGDTFYNFGTCNTSTASYIGASGNISNPAAGSELVLGGGSGTSVNGVLYASMHCDSNTDNNIPGRNLHLLKGKVNYSIRAELIKTGDITTSGALSIIGAVVVLQL
ncbi:hypothetical protein I2494_02530 [Budviciaceae bacterium BWR-B9]|uniref:Fimbrial protein n=1 Tax=Limnobaculum allomyrinae TaxID=2791986 RepID=A0ABS1ILI4_9GAMM|nr:MULTISPECIES: hypothetical protein [Limnobaculum]MBK5142610.1 hypothetical protein [Limnobaculum allomyrinae]MBV7690504.1 hypothetical protein [Limnobaculum sp. M2-1]